jgi:hypothetical protein
MKLDEYIEKLKKIHKEHGNIDIVYATDDEGNAFHFISYSPGIGYIDNKIQHTVAFYSEKEIKEIEKEGHGLDGLDIENLVKVVCLN